LGQDAQRVALCGEHNAIGWNENRTAIAGYLAGLHAEGPDGITPFSLIWKALRGRTLNADLIDSFKSCEISRGLLLDHNKLASVHARLTVLADTSTAFTTAFGHPALSPWSDLPLGDIQRYDVDRLISNLIELRTVRFELAGYFERYATPLAIETVADVGHLVEIDRSIGNPPDGSPIAEISDLDLVELARGLLDKRSLIEIDRALSDKPDLSGADPKHLALASSLIASQAPATLIHMQPAEAYAAAAEAVEQLTLTIRIIESCSPILRALSIDGDFPSDSLCTVAVATLISAQIPDQHRAWMGTLPNVDETAFSTAHARWNGLSASESDWRRKANGHGSNPWPGTDELRDAAVILRKSGLGGAIAAINGSRRAARALTAGFGFSGSAATLADELGQLADHVQAIVDFEADGDAAQLLGGFWQGILTPFNEIAAGAKLRRAIYGQLASLPAGGRVAHQLLSLPVTEFGTLANFASTALSV
jgi:hypothetical protein